MIRSAKITLLLLAMAGSALAQNAPKADVAENPVAQARNPRSWSYGPIANWGTGVGERSDFKFFFAGAHVGKVLTPVRRAGIFSGQFELGADVIPFWQSYTPAAHTNTYTVGDVTYTQKIAGGTYTGVSLTPVIFRWNLLTRSARIQPWFQAAGGLIYTTHKYPPNVLVPEGTAGGTSVWNFSPQGGGGIHYFVRPGRSIDFGVNAVHISSASLGDRNPGVNASIQLQVGYSFWK
ncbi:MAG: acyloxyacyl hydrolase [Acidobacteriaceae bacterium]|nr:acyloxyacyl hydrolase [Acidobacteriaceae bacterium]